APVEVTVAVMAGVVSVPHGWGHDAEDARLSVALAHPGVNTNILTDDRAYDEASGTAVLFGTAVTIEPVGVQATSVYIAAGRDRTRTDNTTPPTPALAPPRPPTHPPH